MRKVEAVKKSIESIAKEYQTTGALFRRNSNSNSKKYGSQAKTAPSNQKTSNILSPDPNIRGDKADIDADDREESRVLNVVLQKTPKNATSETDQSVKHITAYEEQDIKIKENAIMSMVNNLKKVIDERSFEVKYTHGLASEDNDGMRLDQMSDQRLTDSTINMQKKWPTIEDQGIQQQVLLDNITPKSQQPIRDGFGMGNQSPSIIEVKPQTEEAREDKDMSNKSGSQNKTTTAHKILSQFSTVGQEIPVDKINSRSNISTPQSKIATPKKVPQETQQPDEPLINQQTSYYESVDARVQELNSSRTGEAFTLRDQEDKHLTVEQPSESRVPAVVIPSPGKTYGESNYPFAQTDESKDRLNSSEDRGVFGTMGENGETKRNEQLAFTFGNQPFSTEKSEKHNDQGAVDDDDKKVKKSILTSVNAKGLNGGIIDQQPIQDKTQRLSQSPSSQVQRSEKKPVLKEISDTGSILSKKKNEALPPVSLEQSTVNPDRGQKSPSSTRDEFAQTENAVQVENGHLSKKPKSPSIKVIVDNCPTFTFQAQVGKITVDDNLKQSHKPTNSINDIQRFIFQPHIPKQQQLEISSNGLLIKRPSVPSPDNQRKLSSNTQTPTLDKDQANRTSKGSNNDKKAANISINEVKFLNNSIKNLQVEIDSLRDRVSIAEMERDNFLCSHKKSCEEINTLRNQIELLRQNLAERKYTIGELVDLVVASNDPALQAEMNRILNESAFK